MAHAQDRAAFLQKEVKHGRRCETVADHGHGRGYDEAAKKIGLAHRPGRKPRQAGEDQERDDGDVCDVYGQTTDVHGWGTPRAIGGRRWVGCGVDAPVPDPIGLVDEGGVESGSNSVPRSTAEPSAWPASSTPAFSR